VHLVGFYYKNALVILCQAVAQIKFTL